MGYVFMACANLGAALNRMEQYQRLLYDVNPLRYSVVGDVVEHYKRLAMGKLGVTFASDVETATDIASRFRAEGVPAEVVSGKTPDHLRASILRRFKNREILQLVNVDLFGEGFDLPAIEVVSMARPTRGEMFIRSGS